MMVKGQLLRPLVAKKCALNNIEDVKESRSLWSRKELFLRLSVREVMWK